MDVQIAFRNEEQEQFFFSRHRNGCFSGGFGNGKTYVMCQRALIMLLSFPGYRYIIARQTFKNLKSTTMQTFFKVVPGGFESPLIKRHSAIDGLTEFVNGSLVYWLHLDAFDEKTLRGIEINSCCLDQAEEIEEAIYLVLDARIGRWDGYTVPDLYLDLYSKWPRNKFGKPRVPNFMDIGVNPDLETHWVYRRYHPESLERKLKYFYIERETDEELNDPETIENMKDRDPEWVDKYFKGKWGASSSQIHIVRDESIINPNSIEPGVFWSFISEIISRGALYRVLDHGDSSPTCCLWFAALNGVHICYREYYVPGATIDTHRQAITDLTVTSLPNDRDLEEHILENYADPQIFKETAQKAGGFWSVAKEYSDTDELDSPPIDWVPADNNEFATRNRINELLGIKSRYTNPITGVNPAPGIYFILRSESYPYGCFQSINQLKSQRKKYIDTLNGKPIYSDERDDKVVDHAYDPIRYYVAMHNKGMVEKPKPKAVRSFATLNRFLGSKKRAITTNG